LRKIGLIDVDYKRGNNIFNTKKLFPNLALMKISAYYKRKGYKVEWYSPLFHRDYEKIFASKVFKWDSPVDPYLKKDMIIGGSGYSLKKKLPDKIEHIYPNYKLYHINYAMGFLTRGCTRACPFCIVPLKEGYIKKNTDLEEFWRGQDHIMLLDNNILAYKKHLELLKILKETGKKIDFNQGLDIRLITPENARLLREIKRWEGARYRFAFDWVKLKPIIEQKLKILNESGIQNTIISFYVLIGFNTTIEQDLMRINFLKERKILAFVMPFNKFNTYQKALTKYVNKHFYKVCNFGEYLESHGTKIQKSTLIGELKNIDLEVSV